MRTFLFLLTFTVLSIALCAGELTSVSHAADLDSVVRRVSDGRVFDSPQTARTTVTVTGRVFASDRADSLGVASAKVSLTDIDGNVRTTLTNPFGYYRFFTVVGEICVIEVNHKRFEFNMQVVALTNDVVNLNFTAVAH
ncbi:MAG: hypothetical protein ABIP75_04785 [Pyrinomonadaceae bacterium]